MSNAFRGGSGNIKRSDIENFAKGKAASAVEKRVEIFSRASGQDKDNHTSDIYKFEA